MELYHSSSSSSSTYTYEADNKQNQVMASLHSVRKTPTKPWKKPVAPLPPNPPRVYKVKPINFKELVQKLTGATAFEQNRLQIPAPTPLNLGSYTPTLPRVNDDVLVPSRTKTKPLSAVYNSGTAATEKMESRPPSAGWMTSDNNFAQTNDALGFSLSPSSSGWSFPILSPGTWSNIEQSIVL